MKGAFCSHKTGKAARVVEWGRLEICCTLRGTGGSNPSLSAFTHKDPSIWCLNLSKAALP